MSTQVHDDVTVRAGRSTGDNATGDGRHSGSKDGAGTAMGARVPVVHRLGAVAVGGFMLVFGILGFAGGLAFFSTEGQRVLGMSSNGLLSTISVVTAVVLIAAAVRGPRMASTVMLVLGPLFLLSALLNMAVLQTPSTCSPSG